MILRTFIIQARRLSKVGAPSEILCFKVVPLISILKLLTVKNEKQKNKIILAGVIKLSLA